MFYTEYRTVLKCDRCQNASVDILSPHKYTRAEAIETHNWHMDLSQDYCPECIEQLRSGGQNVE